MKVVNWSKWQRTKGMIAGAFVLGGLGYMGGLEDEPGEMPKEPNFLGVGYMGGLEDEPGEMPKEPNFLGVLVCLSIAGMIVWNIYQRDKQNGRPW